MVDCEVILESNSMEKILHINDNFRILWLIGEIFLRASKIEVL